jgi:hypothetical protein
MQVSLLNVYKATVLEEPESGLQLKLPWHASKQGAALRMGRKTLTTERGMPVADAAVKILP